MKDGDDEDSSLSHTGDGLADDVHALNGMWDALLLDFGRMLKTTIIDRSVKLTLKQKFFETGSVNTSVGSWSTN